MERGRFWLGPWTYAVNYGDIINHLYRLLYFFMYMSAVLRPCSSSRSEVGMRMCMCRVVMRVVGAFAGGHVHTFAKTEHVLTRSVDTAKS